MRTNFNFIRQFVKGTLLKPSLPHGVQSKRMFRMPPTVMDDKGIMFDLYSKLMNERIIMLIGPIDDYMSTHVVASLIYLQSLDAKSPIHLYINSQGGSVTSGLAIYDTMQYIQPPVCTWCIGQAASMGSFLLAAGAPGARYALPYSRIMVHQVLGSAQGQASDIQIQAEEIIRIKKQLNQLYVKHTGQPYDVIEKTMDRDRFMTPEEAKEFGLIDNIMERPPVGKKTEEPENS